MNQNKRKKYNLKNQIPKSPFKAMTKIQSKDLPPQPEINSI